MRINNFTLKCIILCYNSVFTKRKLQDFIYPTGHRIQKVKIIMNPVIEAIKNRRSIRAYEPKPVPRDIINVIIEAGNQAPFTSLTRSQPWRFVVAQNPEFKQKLLQTTLPFWKNATGGMKKTAPEL
jgi:hypothetical protein